MHVNRPLLTFPPITALDTVLARFCLQALTTLVVAVIILGGLVAISQQDLAIDIRPLGIGFLLAIMLGLRIGTFNCWAFARWPMWERVWVIVSRPVFLISCVFFTFAALPNAVKDVLWWNPVVHIVGLARAGIHPSYNGAHVSPDYVLTLGGGILVVGFWLLYRRAPRIAGA